MARILRPLLDDQAQYRGLEWIFEYTNEDGALRTWNCGQAAAATFLTHHGKMDPVQAAHNMARLEELHPPDQVFGWFGTGRRRVERMLRSFDLDIVEVRGREAIERELNASNPVMLMLGVAGRKLLGANLPGSHWMVAYGHDSHSVHFTNGWPLSWAEIESGWHSIAARWIAMNGRGLAVRR